MAILQSPIGKRQQAVGRPQSAGAVHEQTVTYVMSAGVTAASDKIELGVLPPFARVVDMILIPEGTLTDITVDVGFMSGEPGDPDNARTVGDELFEDIELDEGVKRLVKAAAFLTEPVPYARSIGAKVTAGGNISGATSKKLTMRLLYAQKG